VNKKKGSRFIGTLSFFLIAEIRRPSISSGLLANNSIVAPAVYFLLGEAQVLQNLGGVLAQGR